MAERRKEEKERADYIRSLPKCIVKKPVIKEVTAEESFGPHSYKDADVNPLLAKFVPGILDGSINPVGQPAMVVIPNLLTIGKNSTEKSCNYNGQEKVMENLDFVPSKDEISDLKSCSDEQSQILSDNANEIIKRLNRSVSVLLIGRDLVGQKENSLSLDKKKPDIFDNNEVDLPLGIRIVPEWNEMMPLAYNFRNLRWTLEINFTQKKGQCKIFSKEEIFKEIDKLRSNNADPADLSEKAAGENNESRKEKRGDAPSLNSEGRRISSSKR